MPSMITNKGDLHGDFKSISYASVTSKSGSFSHSAVYQRYGDGGVESHFEKNNLHRTAFHMYIFATVITPFVVLTGLQEAEHLHLSHPILTIHRNFALLTMWGSLVSLPILWLAKKKGEKVLRIIFIVFLLMFAAFVSVTGYNGGRMVYEYGVGTEQ